MENTQAYQKKEDIILEKLLQDTGKIDAGVLKEAISQKIYMVEQGTYQCLWEMLVNTNYISEHELKEIIPGYTIIETLGESRTGIVYKAKQNVFDRIVAIKIFDSQIKKQDLSLVQIFREIYAYGKLKHPNIINGFDSGEIGKFYYVVFEYFDGIKLSEYIKGKEIFEEKEIVSIGKAILEALVHIWQQGMLHRSVSPKHVMINGDIIKVCELGKIKNSLKDELQTTYALPSTDYNFMSPEQIRGDPLDFRSDLYSLGALLYYMATGHHHINYLYDSSNEKPSQIKPINHYRQDFSKESETIIMQMINREAKDRSSSIEEVKNLIPCFSQILNALNFPNVNTKPKYRHITILVTTTFLLTLISTYLINSILNKEKTIHFFGHQNKLSKTDGSRIYFKYANSIVLIRSQNNPNKIGSGVFIIYQRKFFILTNEHVVRDDLEVKIKLKNGQKFYGQVFKINKLDDLALIKIPRNLQNIKGIPLANIKKNEVGDNVFVIGHPRGYEWSLSSGTISGIRKGTIQTDAAVNPGNSGGALLNNKGELIGIVTFIIKESNNLSFAISAKKIKLFLKSSFNKGLCNFKLDKDN